MNKFWPLTSMHHHGLIPIYTDLLSTNKLVCVVGVLMQYGCRCIIQVDPAHWWGLKRFPPFIFDEIRKLSDP